MNNKNEKRIVKDILSIIEDICFGAKYLGYRVNYGSKGTMDLVIKTIKEKYGIDN
jgi:hypothetical protein